MNKNAARSAEKRARLLLAIAANEEGTSFGISTNEIAIRAHCSVAIASANLVVMRSLGLLGSRGQSLWWLNYRGRAVVEMIQVALEVPSGWATLDPPF